MNTPKSLDELYPDPWLRPADLVRPYVLTIVRCDVEKVHSILTGKDELAAILDFGRKKRMILNKTQGEAVADVAQSRNFDDWAGVRIQVSAGRATNGKATIVIRPAPAPCTNPITAIVTPTPPPPPTEDEGDDIPY